MKKENIVVRIPPSPTGYFHIGRARTALFNYLFAKKDGGKIVFRLEDTDKERSKREFEEDIIQTLAWLGITYDEGPFRQSERLDIYKRHIEKMLKEGSAYISNEPEGENKEVIRFKNPNKTITFYDSIRGDISFDTSDLKDFVIARNINEPLYHLTVVVDDYEMGVTHVIRGDDGISNTPRQILLQEAIGAKRPHYTHLPLILAQDRSKMSARHGAVSLRDFKAAGYLPEALVNYLALLGWNPGTPQEIFNRKELISEFDLGKIQKGGAIFNTEKLDWVNKEHVKQLGKNEKREAVIHYLKTYKKADWNIEEVTSSFIELIIERIKKWGDIKILVEEGELDYFFASPILKKEEIAWKKDADPQNTCGHLQKAGEIIGNLQNTDYNANIIKERLMEYAIKEGKGSVLWPLRFALTGRERSPDPFILAEILGKKETLRRWEKAIEILNQK